MSDESLKKRLYRAKKRTIERMSMHKRVLCIKDEPVHYFIPRILTYIRYDVDCLSPDIRKQLEVLKKESHPETCISVLVYKENEKFPTVIEI
jgi:hypothetical protein